MVKGSTPVASYPIVAARGVRIVLRPLADRWGGDDRAAFFQVVMAGEYDELLRAIHPGDTVLDAGANIGCFTVLAAKRSGSSGKVIAVEPDRLNATQLRKNLELNRLSNTLVVRKALTDVPDCTVAFAPGGVMAHVTPEGTETVLTTTLQVLADQVGLKKFDIVKIDVEGSEERILASLGATRILADGRALGVEVHSTGAEQSFRAALCASGFEVFGPRTESRFLPRLVPRIAAHPILTATLYRGDLLQVAKRVVIGVRRLENERDRYPSGVLIGVRAA